MRRFLFCSLLMWSAVLSAQRRGGGNGRGGGGRGGIDAPVASLKTVTVPQAAGLNGIVKDQTALVALGKALFWDMQAGSDGRTACATCHFHAGADHRLQNQLSGNGIRLNGVLRSQDFPFRLFSDPSDNRSAMTRDTRQVAGSSGVVEKIFADVTPGKVEDVSHDRSTPSPFQIGGVHVRQVTARNSPSVINAAFYSRNFWDGRASSVFTGATPFGESDKGFHAWVYRDGGLRQEPVHLENSSLASQAVGPALNGTEMSWSGRGWQQLGRKMLNLAPLARQKVSVKDSVLGRLANAGGKGLQRDVSYAGLIQTAFQPQYWRAVEMADGYTQMERNFPLFWGLAIQAYEGTLVADDSRVDQFLEGRPSLNALEEQGLRQFQRRGSQCTNCHNGAELSSASLSNIQRRNGNVRSAADAGFFRVGVTPVQEDPGLGGKDTFGLPLWPLDSGGNPDGAFKTPGLRNVEFTGPYFHDGSQATLEQVLDFYGRHGDFPAGGLGRGMGNIRLSAEDRAAIVAFLKALSDERVRFQRAPFDHPSLCVPNGHAELSSGRVEPDKTQTGSIARDKWAFVPEVGKEGSAVPLQTFEEMLRGIGNDGSRANTLTTACLP